MAKTAPAVPESHGNAQEKYVAMIDSLDIIGLDKPSGHSLSAFDVCPDFINKSPRLGATPLDNALVAAKVEKHEIPEALSETEIIGLNPARHMYLKYTEPLFNDRVFINLYNREIELKKMMTPENEHKIKPILKECEKRRADYMAFMNEHRIELLQEARDKFVDALKEKAKDNPEILKILDELTTIRRDAPSGEKGSLETRHDCLVSYAQHQILIEKAQKILAATKSSDVTSADLDALNILCNHHNDAAYQKPKFFTRMELFFSGLKVASAVVGFVFTVIGMAGLIPSGGGSTALIAAGVGLIASPSLIEGIGHTIHVAYRKRMPDTARLVMMGVSLVTGALAFAGLDLSSVTAIATNVATPAINVTLVSKLVDLGVGAISVLGTATARQFVSPRQNMKDFIKNLWDGATYTKAFIQRAKKVVPSTRGAKETEKQPAQAVVAASSNTGTAKSEKDYNSAVKARLIAPNSVKRPLRMSQRPPSPLNAAPDIPQPDEAPIHRKKKFSFPSAG